MHKFDVNDIISMSKKKRNKYSTPSDKAFNKSKFMSSMLHRGLSTSMKSTYSSKTGKCKKRNGNLSYVKEPLWSKYLKTPKTRHLKKKYFLESPRNNSSMCTSVEEHKKSLMMQFPSKNSHFSPYEFYGIPSYITERFRMRSQTRC